MRMEIMLPLRFSEVVIVPPTFFAGEQGDPK
jgi:hypothetical protein